MADREPNIMTGQNRAPNTIELRKKYTAAKLAAAENGTDIEPFEEWAAKNYGNKKILHPK